MRIFNKEQQEFVENNVVGKTSEELTYLVNQKYKLNITVKQIKQYKKSHKLKSGVITKFQSGQAPYNKKPMGSEFISSDGYTYIKIAEPNTWRHKQIYVYEQKYGKIPEGYSVVFADKDKANFNLDNLVLVENKDKLTAKNKNLIFEDKELTRTGLLIARLINKASKVKKNKGEE